MAFKPLQGVVKLMIGTTVDVKELKQDVDNNVKGAAQQMKKLHGVAASVTGASLVGIGAISVGLFKAAQTAIAFEETFAGIKKTVEASTNQFGAHLCFLRDKQSSQMNQYLVVLQLSFLAPHPNHAPALRLNQCQ